MTVQEAWKLAKPKAIEAFKDRPIFEIAVPGDTPMTMRVFTFIHEVDQGPLIRMIAAAHDPTALANAYNEPYKYRVVCEGVIVEEGTW